MPSTKFIESPRINNFDQTNRFNNRFNSYQSQQSLSKESQKSPNNIIQNRDRMVGISLKLESTVPDITSVTLKKSLISNKSGPETEIPRSSGRKIINQIQLSQTTNSHKFMPQQLQNQILKQINQSELKKRKGSGTIYEHQQKKKLMNYQSNETIQSIDSLGRLRKSRPILPQNVFPFKMGQITLKSNRSAVVNPKQHS